MIIRLTEKEFKALEWYDKDVVYFLTDCGMIIMPSGGEVYLKEFKDDLPESDAAKYKNDYLYTLAELDNFRKRTIKEKAEIRVNTEMKIIKDLLPIIDNFERSKQFLDEESLKGVSLIYASFINLLANYHVDIIKPELGEKFDEKLHEAVMTNPADENEPAYTIHECIEKGYAIGDKIIRYAKVVVNV